MDYGRLTLEEIKIPDHVRFYGKDEGRFKLLADTVKRQQQ